MRYLSEENKLSCVVEYGTLISKRDMIRVLRDLDKVKYTDLIDSVVVTVGEGYVIEVSANDFDSTIIFNNRLHLNVNGFDYLSIKSSPEKEVSLISGHRQIRLTPLVSDSDNAIQEDIDEQRIAMLSQLACDNEEELDYFID